MSRCRRRSAAVSCRPSPGDESPGGCDGSAGRGGRNPRRRRLRETVDFSYDGVLRSVDESLARLGTDHLDIALLHEPDLAAGVTMSSTMSGGFRALERSRAEGIVGAIGIGTNDVGVILDYLRAGDFDAVLIGLRYTLMDQEALDVLLPFALSRGVGVIIGGVFHGGLLADPRPGATFDYRPATASETDRAVRLRDLCAEHGVSLRDAALQFPIRHPAVTSVLTGVKSVDELEANVAGFARPIPDALWDAIAAEDRRRSTA